MPEHKSKVLIMAGGTGGHIFPALTIARYLQDKGVEVEWLGTRAGLEARVIGETDIPLHFISVSGLRGKSVVRKLLAPLVILVAIAQALMKLLKIRPGCVLGMGGFVTGPGGVAAWLMGKPLLIHEQNAIAGASNQLLFPLASHVMEAFPGAFMRKRELTNNRFLRNLIKADKAMTIGNPVRQEITQLEPAEQRLAQHEGKLKLLVIGGSLGAVAFNEIVPACLAMFARNDQPEVRHQCGSRNLADTRGSYDASGVAVGDGISVEEFIEDMAAAYNWADLVLCRSGASTVSELAAIGLPSILIPYPYAVDDHQTENARVLNNLDAAWLIPQQEFSAQVLFNILKEIAEYPQLLVSKAQAARKAGIKDATARAAACCMEACLV